MNFQDSKGNSALHIAVDYWKMSSHTPVESTLPVVLVKSGANPQLKSISLLFDFR